jgi:hypothetical protein
MGAVIIWVVFFAVIQALGWLFYWRREEPLFPAPTKHAKPTLVLETVPDLEESGSAT